jgi:thioredoxin reductase (NADPH)
MRRVLVLHTGASRAALIPTSHNVPGYPGGISGPALLNLLEQQALKYGTSIELSRVVALTRAGDLFGVEHAQGFIHAHRVILSSGILDHNPAIRDIGRAILGGELRYCPVCDGYEAKDKRICVIGPAKSAVPKAVFMRTYSKDVTIICPAMDDHEFENDLRESDIKVVLGDIVEVVRQDAVAVVLSSSGALEFDIVYPALGCTPQSNLATLLGADVDPDGALLVDKNQETSIKGLYAAGDVVSQLDQISVAFGHAAVAATHIHNSLPANFR